MTEFGGIPEEHTASLETVSLETSRTKYFVSIQERMERLSQGIALANNLESSTITPKQAVKFGVKAMSEMIKGKDTPGALLMKNIVSESKKSTSRYLKEIGIRPSQLVKTPLETMGRMFNIDSQTAQRMLEMFGIRTDELVFQQEGNGTTRAAMVADLMGSSMLLIQQDDEEAPVRPHSTSRPLSKPVADPDDNTVAKTAGKIAGGALNKAWKWTLWGGAIVLVAACTTMTVLTLNPGGFGDTVKNNAVEPTLLPVPTAKPDSQQREDTDKANADEAEGNYQKGSISLDPKDISVRAVLRQLAYYDWDWWYIKDPKNQSIMDKVFAGFFSEEEISKIKIDKSYFFTALDTIKNKTPENQRGSIQKIIDIYNKRKDCGSTCNPQQFLRDANSSSMLNRTRQIEKLALRAVDRGFANTGLRKSEVLRRQGYKV